MNQAKFKFSELKLRRLVPFYVALILIHIYLPEPLWLLRPLISYVALFVLGLIFIVAIKQMLEVDG